MTIPNVANPSPRSWQAQLLAARFGMALETAAVVASLALMGAVHG